MTCHGVGEHRECLCRDGRWLGGQNGSGKNASLLIGARFCMPRDRSARLTGEISIAGLNEFGAAHAHLLAGRSQTLIARLVLASDAGVVHHEAALVQAQLVIPHVKHDVEVLVGVMCVRDPRSTTG